MAQPPKPLKYALRIWSGRERLALGICIAIGFLSRISLAFRSNALISTRPYTEDAFFALSCARNLAMGRGFTIDGVHATNGVQPLIVLLYAPCFLLANTDRWLGLRLTMVLGALIQVIGTYLIASLVRVMERNDDALKTNRVFTAPIIAAWIWTTSVSIFLHNSNGLETGLYGLLLLTAAYCYGLILQGYWHGMKHWATLGVVLGFTILSRIDSAVLLPVFAISELLRLRGRAVKHVFVVCALAIVICSPWFIYGQLSFGSIMPVSGQAEALNISIRENLVRSIYDFADVLTVFLFTPYYGEPVWLLAVWSVVLPAIVIAVSVRYKLLGELLERFNLRPVWMMLVFGMVLSLYYIFLFGAPHFIPRYHHPLRVFWSIAFAAALPIIRERLRSKKEIFVFRFLLALLVMTSLIEVGRYYTRTTVVDFYVAGIWAAQHPEARVGMMQSGTASFVSANVVNLDGKVNVEALQARQHHTFDQYLANQQFDYLMDWEQYMIPMVRDAAQHRLRYSLEDSIGLIHIYKLQKQ